MWSFRRCWRISDIEPCGESNHFNLIEISTICKIQQIRFPQITGQKRKVPSFRLGTFKIILPSRNDEDAQCGDDLSFTAFAKDRPHWHSATTGFSARGGQASVPTESGAFSQRLIRLWRNLLCSECPPILRQAQDMAGQLPSGGSPTSFDPGMQSKVSLADRRTVGLPAPASSRSENACIHSVLCASSHFLCPDQIVEPNVVRFHSSKPGLDFMLPQL